jgi:hypothetical protein
MAWIDRAAQLFQMLGLIGAGLGIYVFVKNRSPWAALATLSCAVGFILPFYWLQIPAALINWLVPYTKTGIGVSLLLNVGPWIYLLPNALPDVKRRRRSGRRR